MQTIIYLIRHGEVHNPQGILYGRLPNYGLTKKGKQEIENAAEFLKNKQIDAIYASPLTRTNQSATIIQKKLSIPKITFDEHIIEVKTSYQGRKYNELDPLQSEIYFKPLDPSDETLEQITQRMKTFIEKLVEKHKGEHIIVISHGDPIMALKASIENKQLEFSIFRQGPYIKHGEIYQITADDKNKLSIQSVFQSNITT
ncbi:MAG TPA: histidine phosphatase family protein [Candidatus Sulfotelmatobacter sp.]|jgi:broad specificity phosphatase PhoE|nr:histidine phosphatase family protein [Candidatus Sulfotelmatobacter sp.]